MQQPNFEPEQIYHIYNRANGSENLFRNRENYRYFLRKYQEKTSGVADIIAYCLMPNHFHLLVKIKEKKELEDVIIHENIKTRKLAIPLEVSPEEQYHFIVRRTFHNFFIGYAKAFNKYHSRQGSLLQQNSKRIIVLDEVYLLNVIIYIHLNPVKHGFTVKPEAWPYSSFHIYLDDKPNLPLANQIIEWFGGRTAFIKAHIGHGEL